VLLGARHDKKRSSGFAEIQLSLVCRHELLLVPAAEPVEQAAQR
jgi:hypothetical protein